MTTIAVVVMSSSKVGCRAPKQKPTVLAVERRCLSVLLYYCGETKLGPLLRIGSAWLVELRCCLRAADQRSSGLAEETSHRLTKDEPYSLKDRPKDSPRETRKSL